jgi:cysteinyl-tRNA synthetase, unknown class
MLVPTKKLLATALFAWAAMAAQPVLAQARDNPFLKAKSWAFQLKNLGPEEQAKIAASPFDMVVIDASQFVGPKEVALTKAEVDRMKLRPDGSKRLVIAYFSVGEAESYRNYWKPEWTKSKPSWVGKENKEWKENYLVKYWDPTWQNIVYPFADRVIESGFDGFYIDRADAYYYYGDTTEKRNQMTDFIIKLTAHMRAKKPDVAILVQNAEELLEKPAYVAAIDGIAKEDLLYGINHKEEPNKIAEVDWSTKLLKVAQDKGKAIFVIEYLTRPNYIADAKKRLDERGFVMYTGPRGLAALNLSPAVADGPRRGPLDPTPENPSAQTPLGKAKNAVKNAVSVTKEKAQRALEKAKAATKGNAPAKTN